MNPKKPEQEQEIIQHALLTIREMKKTIETQTSEPIAVVGFSCRVPGANSCEAFWHVLSEGQDAIESIPTSRWNSEALYDPDPMAPGKVATRWAGLIDAWSFDADFFGLSDEEALHMDPQQRVFLEVAWEALEHAKQNRDSLRGSQTGVFVGAVNYNHGYAQRLYAEPQGINAFSGPGLSHSMLAGRLAYFLDLKGPCLAIDTACSSSLVAVHQACLSLRAKECHMAITGGVNLILSPGFSMATSRMHLLAKDGRCKPFDERADGIVRSDGCGVVILKRLGDARRDHDAILAVIRGSAVNQDGKTNGLTAPSGHAQEQLIRTALAQAKLGVDDLGYVEAHGTGTHLGDPIETAALHRVLASRKPQIGPCWVGSVKANVGHCEAAAGIVSLIKVILCLQKRCIPRQIHLAVCNPHIEAHPGVFDFPRRSIPWPHQQEKPLCAGISSFGWSGTNAHMIMGLPDAPEGATIPASLPKTTAKLALVFSGQGSQWPGMVDDWLAQEPVFCAQMQACHDIIQRDAHWSLLDAVSNHTTLDLSQTGWAQACVAAVQISLFEWLKAKGVRSHAVVGHSMGELSAAYAAGILNLEQTLWAVLERGRCMEKIRGQGCMYVVLSSSHLVRALLSDHPHAYVSAVNSPYATVISVASDGVDAVVQHCTEQGIDLMPINPHYPFHCPVLEPVVEELRQAFSVLEHQEPTLTFVSSSNTEAPEAYPHNAQYWLNNALHPVYFEHAVRHLAQMGCDAFIELGPNAPLLQHIKHTFAHAGHAQPRLGGWYTNTKLASKA